MKTIISLSGYSSAYNRVLKCYSPGGYKKTGGGQDSGFL